MEQSGSAELVDPAVLKSSFATVAAHGDDVAMYFYNYLFLIRPELRPTFPLAMGEQRDRLLAALVHIVTNVDRMDHLEPYLAGLGRDHRRFGVVAEHYPAVGEALLATLAHFTGPDWTRALDATWSDAYARVAGVMTAAAAAATGPAWYDGEIVGIDRVCFDLAVLRVRTDEVVPYRAGQSMALQATVLRPRIWRPYTPASMPGSREFDLHVHAVGGGSLSTALVRAARPGEPVRLGAPYGRMVLEPSTVRPLLMIAGGTGLAPMLALLQEVAVAGGRPTHLFHGARTVRELYAIDRLDRLVADHRSWLTVVTATSDDDSWAGPHGRIGELAAGAGEWTGHDVYVCGSPEMVEGTVKALVSRGVSEDHIVFEEFGKA